MTSILLVDDDFDIRDSLEDILRDEGFHVATASDGFEAMEVLRAANPAPRLILLDWMMPRCDGAQFRALQLAEPALAEIPVVLLTADARVEEKLAAIQIEEILQKPVRLDHLLRLVRRYCGDAKE